MLLLSSLREALRCFRRLKAGFEAGFEPGLDNVDIFLVTLKLAEILVV